MTKLSEDARSSFYHQLHVFSHLQIDVIHCSTAHVMFNNVARNTIYRRL